VLARLATIDDLAIASGRKFAVEFGAAVALFTRLADRYFDAPTRDCLKSLAGQPSDSAPCREWCQTIYEIRGFCEGLDAVPNSSYTSHLDIDRGDAGRVAELLLWQLFGAVAKPGSRLTLPPIHLPLRLALGGLGMLRLEGVESSLRLEKLDWSGDRPALRDNTGASSFGSWEPHIGLAGPGVCATIPLGDRALTSARLQDFPIVRSRAYAHDWSSVVLRGARDIAEYSPLASAAVERFVTHVLPLLCGDHAIGSASRQEALGLVFLPAVLDQPDQFAECLLHEAMHQYLFRLEACARLFDPASPLAVAFFSPWRNDKRPLRMTLHGGFVFAAVADMYLWVANSPRWGLDAATAQRRAYQRYRESLLALGVVRKYAIMSSVGDKVIEAIESDLATIHARLRPRPEDAAEVDRAIEEHLRVHDHHLH